MKTDETAKSKARVSSQYPIDFVVPLQLEECVHRIEQSQRAYYPDLSRYTVEIKVTRRLDQNRFLFNGRFYKPDSESYICWMEGTFTRWQGTSTRIIGKGHLRISKEPNEVATFLVGCPSMIVCLCVVGILLQLAAFWGVWSYLLAVFVLGITLISAIRFIQKVWDLPVSRRVVQKMITQILMEHPMKTDDELTKAKTRGSRQYPIDFVVPLQLEECVHRIEHSKRELFPDLSRYSIELKVLRRIDRNRVLFNGRFYKPSTESFVCRIEGTFTRWEGTSTRIIGKAFVNYDVVNALLPKTLDSFSLGLNLSLILSTLGACLIIVIAPSIPFPSCLFLTILLAALGMLLSQAYFNRRENPPLPLTPVTMQKVITYVLMESETVDENR